MAHAVYGVLAAPAGRDVRIGSDATAYSVPAITRAW